MMQALVSLHRSPTQAKNSRAARGRRSFVAALVLAGSTLGCSYQAHHGGPLARAEAVDLRVKNYRTFGAAWNAVVEAVDGEPTPWAFRESSRARNFLFNGIAGGEKTIALAPGRHTVELSLVWDQLLSGNNEDADAPSHCSLTFVALPGEEYEVASAYWLSGGFGQWIREERDWTAWVVRAETREVVSEERCTPETDVAALQSTHG